MNTRIFSRKENGPLGFHPNALTIPMRLVVNTRTANLLELGTGSAGIEIA